MKSLIPAFAVALLLGCASSESPQQTDVAGSGTFIAHCTSGADCATALCLRVDPTGGICTKPCVDDSGCPAGDNWKCITPAANTPQVCACKKLAAIDVCGNGLDDDCNGKVDDDCMECGGLTVSKNDPLNCGSCGHACRDDESCRSGACGCANSHLTSCSASCVDTSTDRDNCGSCGKACVGDQVCNGGTCACPTSSAPDLCGTSCVDKKTDRTNCGGCGNVCPSAQSCDGGACVCPDKGKTLCGSACVDTKTDAANCGACGTACGTGEKCDGGTCTCSTGRTRCGSLCVDTSNDRANCGGCGTTCRSDQLCSGGSCKCSFGTDCDGKCVNTNSDATHCGSCTTACVPGEVCGSGSCSCASGLHCGGACVPKDDPTHCGSCGNACASGQVCSGGTCACATSGLTACGSSCVNTGNDPSNCGACGKACRASETCTGGTCGCPSGGTFCTDSGACKLLSSDAANCGACGKTCRATEVCSGASCTCPAYGQKWCSSATACVDTLNDAKNCGGCDVACPSGTACNYGTCKCTGAGLTLCGSTCTDVKTDAANCGGCGKSCGGTYVCKAGACMCDTPIATSPMRLTNAAGNSERPSFATDGTHVAVTWWDARGISGGVAGNIYFTLLNPDGTRALATDVQLTSFTGTFSGTDYNGPDKQPHVLWTGSQWTVSWVERVPVGTKVEKHLRLRGLTAAGALGTMDVTVTATGLGADTSIIGHGLAWSKTDGYVTAYFPVTASTGSQILFRKLGLSGTDTSAPTTIDLNPVFTSIDGNDVRIVQAPTGEWGLLATNGNQSTFVRLNADGSRTKPIVTLDVSMIPPADLVYDGTTWLTAYVRAAYAGDGELVIARGDDLSSVYSIDHKSTTTASFAPFSTPHIALTGGVLDFVYARRDAAGAGKLTLRRYKVPVGATVAPTTIADPIDVLTTANCDDFAGYAFTRVGNTALAAWSDNRWGDLEVYDASVDLRNCP